MDNEHLLARMNPQTLAMDVEILDRYIKRTLAEKAAPYLDHLEAQQILFGRDIDAATCITEVDNPELIPPEFRL